MWGPVGVAVRCCWRVPRPTADWALDSEVERNRSVTGTSGIVLALLRTMTRRSPVSGGTCEALGDAPEVGDDF